MVFKEFKPFISPRRFVFTDPDTKREFTGTSIPHLARQIRGYREQNELPPLDLLEVVIENYLCTLPIHVGSCQPIKKASRGFVQYLQGGVAFLRNIVYKSFEPQEEADRRGEICTRCPHNVFPDRGPFIKWIDDIAERSIGKLQSKHHNELGICEVCSCPLRSKVFYNGKIKLTKEQRSTMEALIDPKCWQVEKPEKVETAK